MNRKLWLAALFAVAALAGCKKDKKSDEKKTEIVPPETSIPTPHSDPEPEPEPEPEPGPAPRNNATPGVFTEVGTIRQPADTMEMMSIGAKYQEQIKKISKLKTRTEDLNWSKEGGFYYEDDEIDMMTLTPYSNLVTIYDYEELHYITHDKVTEIEEQETYHYTYVQENEYDEQGNFVKGTRWDRDDYDNYPEVYWYVNAIADEDSDMSDWVSNAIIGNLSDPSDLDYSFFGFDGEGHPIEYGFTNQIVYEDIVDKAGNHHVGTHKTQAEFLMLLDEEGHLTDVHSWTNTAYNYDDDGNVYDHDVRGYSYLAVVDDVEYSPKTEWAEKEVFLQNTPKARGIAPKRIGDPILELWTGTYDEETGELVSVVKSSTSNFQSISATTPLDKLTNVSQIVLGNTNYFNPTALFRISGNGAFIPWDAEHNTLGSTQSQTEYLPLDKFNGYEGFEIVTLDKDTFLKFDLENVMMPHVLKGEYPILTLGTSMAINEEGDAMAFGVESVNLEFAYLGGL